MQLKAEQLGAHLSKTLSPVYVVHGDEPLLALANDNVQKFVAGQAIKKFVLVPGRLINLVI